MWIKSILRVLAGVLLGLPTAFCAGYVIRNVTSDEILLCITNEAEHSIVFGYEQSCSNGGHETYSSTIKENHCECIQMTPDCGAFAASIFAGESTKNIVLSPESAKGGLIFRRELALLYNGELVWEK